LLVVCGHLLIKAGLNSAAPTLFNAAFSTKLVHIMRERLVLLGLGIYGLGTLCWMAAVAQSELSLLYPLTSLNYILIAVFSYLLFQESISIRRGSGIAIIALGVILLARSQRRQKQPR
jgi:drug/metabolite transporter (DMT)-like permease